MAFQQGSQTQMGSVARQVTKLDPGPVPGAGSPVAPASHSGISGPVLPDLFVFLCVFLLFQDRLYVYNFI